MPPPASPLACTSAAPARLTLPPLIVTVPPLAPVALPETSITPECVADTSVVASLPAAITTLPPLPAASCAVMAPLFCKLPPALVRNTRPSSSATPVACMAPALFTAKPYTLPPAARSSACTAVMTPVFWTPTSAGVESFRVDLMNNRSSPALLRSTSVPAASPTTPLLASIVPLFTTECAIRKTSPPCARMVPRF